MPKASSIDDAERAIELAAIAGLELDEWQKLLVRMTLARRGDGRWAAREVAAVVARQNGKGGWIEAVELAGLFLLNERLIIHTAHKFSTAMEALYRMRDLITNTPALNKRLAENGVRLANGKEGFTLKNGARLNYKARTQGAGRGPSPDRLIVDEAMDYPESYKEAMMFGLSANGSRKQILYAGSAVNRRVHKNGVVFSQIRSRGLASNDPSLAFAEWSAPGDVNDPAVLAEVCPDENAWAAGNPALGGRIEHTTVEDELRSSAENLRGFAIERLSMGDWHRPEEAERASIIDREAWTLLGDPTGVMKPGSLAIEIQPDFRTASISVAGTRHDGTRYVDITDHRPGCHWVIARAKQLTDIWGLPAALYRDPSPFAALLEDARLAGLSVKPVPSKEQAEASVGFLKATQPPATIVHRGNLALTAATSAATTKPAGASWKWAAGNGDVDITPLWAASLALWGLAAVPQVAPSAIMI